MRLEKHGNGNFTTVAEGSGAGGGAEGVNSDQAQPCSTNGVGPMESLPDEGSWNEEVSRAGQIKDQPAQGDHGHHDTNHPKGSSSGEECPVGKPEAPGPVKKEMSTRRLLLNIVCAGGSDITAVTFIHPIDVVKTRLQIAGEAGR